MADKDTLTVTCPECDSILIVDRNTGEVLEVRKPLVEESSGDRFEDARKRVLEVNERAEKAFKAAQEREKGKLERLEALFKEKKEELKDKPIERPDRPFDLD
ncbi:MAG: hypothetical protein JJU11_07365 [Candidatus Sumerlaeia bacterium]|nr:hypothetical protein [Candidatus Sumerlaeia bacterium]